MFMIVSLLASCLCSFLIGQCLNVDCYLKNIILPFIPNATVSSLDVFVGLRYVSDHSHRHNHDRRSILQQKDGDQRYNDDVCCVCPSYANTMIGRLSNATQCAYQKRCCLSLSTLLHDAFCCRCLCTHTHI